MVLQSMSVIVVPLSVVMSVVCVPCQGLFYPCLLSLSEIMVSLSGIMLSGITLSLSGIMLSGIMLSCSVFLVFFKDCVVPVLTLSVVIVISLVVLTLSEVLLT